MSLFFLYRDGALWVNGGKITPYSDKEAAERAMYSPSLYYAREELWKTKRLHFELLSNNDRVNLINKQMNRF